MRRTFTKHVAVFLSVCGLTITAALPVSSALVDLDLFVTYSILDNTANPASPLADGSWVVIVGSADSVNNGMTTWNGTNYIANSVQGNDIILGYVYIGDNSFANTGKFFQTVSYNTTNNIGYVYIRYFQTPSPGGMAYWGQSEVFNLYPTNYNTVTIDVAPLSSLVASNFNSFVVIPEPDTAALFFMAGGLLFAVRMTQKQTLRKKRIAAMMKRE